MEHDVKGVEYKAVSYRGQWLSVPRHRTAAVTQIVKKVCTKVKVKQEATLTSAAPARTKGYNLRTPKPQVVQMAQEPCVRRQKRKPLLGTPVPPSLPLAQMSPHGVNINNLHFFINSPPPPL